MCEVVTERKSVGNNKVQIEEKQETHGDARKIVSEAGTGFNAHSLGRKGE